MAAQQPQAKQVMAGGKALYAWLLAFLQHTCLSDLLCPAVPRYYFLKELHPAAGGGRYLETPTILKRWLLQAGIGTVPVREVPMANPSDMRFRAFQGQGRRLAD